MRILKKMWTYFSLITLVAMVILPTTTVLAKENNAKKSGQLEVIKVLKLHIPADSEGIQEMIELYESGGWIYNIQEQAFIKRVVHHDTSIKVKGKKLDAKKGDHGLINIPLTQNEELKELEVYNGEKYQKHKVKFKNNKMSSVEVVVNLDEHLKKMEGDYSQTGSEEQGKTASHGLENGEKPIYGQAIHCNRFNGFTGNGRYYSKSSNPVQAGINFFQSDCDVALARSSKCLADYGDNPYCAIHPYSKNGQCSDNIVSHFNGYHKHTSWFGPSGWPS